MVACQTTFGNALGYAAPSPQTAAATFAMNAAANWFALGFVLSDAKTLNSGRAYQQAANGTFSNGTGAGSDWTLEVQTDNAGNPSGSTVTGGTAQPCTTAPNGVGWYDWTGFTAALSAQTQYWLVWKNANGTPATNYPTMQSFASSLGITPIMGSTGKFGWTRATSTNSGSSWTITGASTGFRVGFSDSTYGGSPMQSTAVDATHIDGVSELGLQFTLPGNQQINVRGIAAFFSSDSGVPVGKAFGKLYTGSSPASPVSTGGFLGTVITAQGWAAMYFSSTQVLTGGTIVTATIADDTAESAGKYFRLQANTFDSDSNSLPLLPFQGTAKRAVYNGSTWSYSNGVLIPVCLLTDTNGEFPTVAASGGAPITLGV